MKKISKKGFKPIDQEEEDLMESIERDDWQPAKNFDKEKKGNSCRSQYIKKR
jgi:hypothetical protein